MATKRSCKAMCKRAFQNFEMKVGFFNALFLVTFGRHLQRGLKGVKSPGLTNLGEDNDITTGETGYQNRKAHP